MNNTLNLVIKKTARKLNVDPNLVENVYKSYWSFIKERVSEQPLRDMSQEEFDSSESNFNLPYIGKLYTSYDKIEKYRRRLKFYKDVKDKESKADRNPGSSD